VHGNSELQGSILLPFLAQHKHPIKKVHNRTLFHPHSNMQDLKVRLRLCCVTSYHKIWHFIAKLCWLCSLLCLT